MPDNDKPKNKKISFKLVTTEGHSIKLAVPEGTKVKKVKDKVLPSLKQLQPGLDWSKEGFQLWTQDAALQDNALIGENLSDATLIAKIGKEAILGGAKSQHPKPQQPLSGSIAPKVPSNTSAAQKIVITVQLPGAGNHISSQQQINFKLNPSRVSFSKLRGLLAQNIQKPADIIGLRVQGNEVLDYSAALSSMSIGEKTFIESYYTHPLGSLSRQESAEPSKYQNRDEKTVHIVVEGVGGQKLPMAVSGMTKVKSLAKTVDDEWGVPSELVQISWLGRVLPSTDTLLESGIYNGAILQAVMRRATLSQTAQCVACGGGIDTSLFCPNTGRKHGPSSLSDEVHTISVKSMEDNTEYKIPKIRPTATVLKIKRLLSKSSGFNHDEIVLFNSEGDELKDGFSLQDCNALSAPLEMQLRKEAIYKSTLSHNMVPAPPSHLAVPPNQMQHNYVNRSLNSSSNTAAPNNNNNNNNNTVIMTSPIPPENRYANEELPSPTRPVSLQMNDSIYPGGIRTYMTERRNADSVRNAVSQLDGLRASQYSPSPERLVMKGDFPVRIHQEGAPTGDQQLDKLCGTLDQILKTETSYRSRPSTGLTRTVSPTRGNLTSAVNLSGARRSPSPPVMNEEHDLLTEQRMRAARSEIGVCRPLPTSGTQLDNLEERTLLRMEAARRNELLGRRAHGLNIEYRPIVLGFGLEDPHSVVAPQLTETPAAALSITKPLSEYQRESQTRLGTQSILPCNVEGSYVPRTESHLQRSAIWEKELPTT